MPRAELQLPQERKDEFPGVVVEKLFLRDYPHKELGAQLFGTLREISPKQLKEKKYRGVAAGTRIGAGGLEQQLRPLPARPGRLHAGRRQRARQPRRQRRRHAQRARAGPAAAADARPRASSAPATTRSQQAIAAANGNGDPAKAGAYVAMDPTQRRDPRAGLATRASTPTCSPSRSRRRRSTTLTSEANGAPLFNRAIAAGLSDRLDVQADHRDGGARGGPDHARRRRSSTTASSSSARRSTRTPSGASFGPLNMSRRAQGLLGRLLLHSSARSANAQRPDHPASGRKQARARPPDRDRHPRRVRRPGARPQVARRGLRQVPEVRQAREGAGPDVRGAVRSAAASSGRGRRATTSTSRSARATCRRRRCSWPSPTRRSPTAGASCGRTWRMSVEDGARARRSRSSAPPPGATSSSPRPTRTTILDGPAPRGLRARRHVGRRLQGLAAEAHGLRQDRYRGAAGAARPVLVRLLRAPSQPPDRRRRDRREGRLRCRDGRAGRAPDPLQVVRPRQGQVPRRAARPRDERPRPSSPPPSRRPRSSRASCACAWTRCCCWRRSGSWPAR